MSLFSRKLPRSIWCVVLLLLLCRQLAWTDEFEGEINVAAAPFGASFKNADNHAQLEAAVDAAYVQGRALYFPALNPKGPTIYKTSTLVWKGVSMYGPVCGGVGNYSFSAMGGCVVIEGMPGQDIFASRSPTESGYIAPNRGFVLRDLTFALDDSVDVSRTLGSRRQLGQQITKSQTCGNAAIAIPIVNGAFARSDPGPNGAVVSRVIFISASRKAQHHSCGFYTNAFPYDTLWEKVNFSRLWAGYIDAPPPANPDTQDWASDGDSWRDETFNGDIFPFVEYNSVAAKIDRWDIYPPDGGYGPIILGFKALNRSSSWRWEINDLYIEPEPGSQIPLWLMGNDFVLNDLTISGTFASPIILDIRRSRVNGATFANAENTSFAIMGDHNSLEGIVGDTLKNLYTDRGRDNSVCIVGVSNTELTERICEVATGDGTTEAFALPQTERGTPRIYVNGELANPPPTIRANVAAFIRPPVAGAVIQEQQ